MFIFYLILGIAWCLAWPFHYHDDEWNFIICNIHRGVWRDEADGKSEAPQIEQYGRRNELRRIYHGHVRLFIINPTPSIITFASLYVTDIPQYLVVCQVSLYPPFCKTNSLTKYSVNLSVLKFKNILYWNSSPFHYYRKFLLPKPPTNIPTIPYKHYNTTVLSPSSELILGLRLHHNSFKIASYTFPKPVFYVFLTPKE